jgi:hypothetical protein
MLSAANAANAPGVLAICPRGKSRAVCVELDVMVLTVFELD